MASVWLARIEGKHGFEKLVAVKTILPKYASDDQFQKMLLDEARIASRIEHMNAAQILDLGEHHDVLYVVLEWVEGESLSRLSRVLKRKERMIPHGILLRILSDACGGLHAAHELRGLDGRLLGVVHRDVSPQNILVNTAGVAKLIDFGIAKAKDRLVGETSAGVLKGKVRYMAPEQAMGRPTDRRADIWAVGAMLYRLLCGKAPYEGENDLASLNLLTAGKPPPPLPPTVHPSIVAIVHRALTHAPDGRFATAAALQAAMEAAMQDAGVVTTTAGVAAFAAEHLAPYTEKRQSSVQLALAAATERQRMRKLLENMAHPEVSTDVSEIGGAPPSETTIVDDVEVTQQLDGPALPPPPLLPTPSAPPRRSASEPPTRTLETFIRVPLARISMRTAVIAAGGAVTFLVVLIVLSLAGRARPATATAAGTAPVPAQTAAVLPHPVIPPPPPTTVAQTNDPPKAAPTDDVPIVSANDLPRVQDPEPFARVRPPAPPPVARMRAAEPEIRVPTTPIEPKQSVSVSAPRGPSSPKARIDDGF
jgi:serine/threonine-protein kinase